MSAKKERSGYDEFMALSDAEKERVWESFNREIPLSETRPLNARERAEWERAKRSKWVSVEEVKVYVERGLLGRADAYAEAHGMTRAQLVAAGLTAVIGPAGTNRRKGTAARARRKSS